MYTVVLQQQQQQNLNPKNLGLALDPQKIS